MVLKRIRTFFLVFSVLMTSAPPAATPQGRQTANILKLEKKENMPAASIRDAAWIAGHWRAEALGGVAEEVWAPPLGNSMVGMFRLVKDGKVGFYELLTIVEENGSLVLRLKHFSADFVGWEEKDVSISFPLVKLTTSEANFDGMTFRMMDDGSLKVFVSSRNRKTGEVGELEFSYRPVADEGNGRKD